MNADEIVRALRDYASDCDDCSDCFYCDFACVCGKCGGNAPKIIADLIDSLTAQLTDYHHMEQLVDGKMAENQRLRKINEKLQSQLAESQSREKAAVECIEDVNKNLHESVWHNSWEEEALAIIRKWRGPQEAGKGKAE